MPHRALPFIIFPFLTAAASRFIFSHSTASGLVDKLRSHCGVPLDGYSDWLSDRHFLLPYTGHLGADRHICGYVTIFHALMNSPNATPFVEYFLATGAPLTLFTMVEGYRQGQNVLLRYPIIWLLLTQLYTFGAIHPTYCMLLVVTGGIRRARHIGAGSFSQVQAESLVFGIIVGGALPSLAMVAFDNPWVTWIWQIYPILISISQFIYLFIRRSSRHSRSGYSTLRVAYIMTFLLSAYWHVTTIWQRPINLLSLASFFRPTVALLPRTTDISAQVHDLLKWDYVLGYSAASIALLWHAQNIRQVVAILSWYAITTPLLGIGSAFTVVAMWRDGMLSEHRK